MLMFIVFQGNKHLYSPQIIQNLCKDLMIPIEENNIPLLIPVTSGITNDLTIEVNRLVLLKHQHIRGSPINLIEIESGALTGDVVESGFGFFFQGGFAGQKAAAGDVQAVDGFSEKERFSLSNCRTYQNLGYYTVYTVHFIKIMVFLHHIQIIKLN